MGNDQKISDLRRRRLKNALWGLFIGDALAMPAHWYYNIENIPKAFNGGIRGYVDPPHPHPDSFMVGMSYEPDVENAKRLGRPYDILHEHARFYNTSYSTLQIRNTERENEHGNPVPPLEARIHYHHGLKAGENTLGAHLVRVLMRTVIGHGRYDPNAFIEGFIEHMTTSGRNRDPYTEFYIRRWFENYAGGSEPHACAELQRHMWSIGSHGGIIRPMVVSMLAESVYQGLGLAIEHQNLTHRSENVASALGVLIPLLGALLRGEDPGKTISSYAHTISIARVTGEELSAAYRAHNGPDNIPKPEMWALHTTLTGAHLDVDRLIRDHSDQEVVGRLFSIACYPEQGLPLLLYLAQKYNVDVEATLFANANAGGDNVHRGMILGVIVGAANDGLPSHLMQGLVAFDELNDEIEAFTDIALSGKAI